MKFMYNGQWNAEEQLLLLLLLLHTDRESDRVLHKKLYITVSANSWRTLTVWAVLCYSDYPSTADR